MSNPNDDDTGPDLPKPDFNSWWPSNPWSEEPAGPVEDGTEHTRPLNAPWSEQPPPSAETPWSEQSPPPSETPWREYSQWPGQIPPASESPWFGASAEAVTHPAMPLPDPTLVGPFPSAPNDAPPPGYYPPAQYYPAMPVPPTPRSHKLRNSLLAVGAVAVVTAAVFVFVDVAHGTHNTAGLASASNTPQSHSPGPSVSSTPISTTQSFDPSMMNAASTDPIPFTSDALLPPNFADSKGVEYTLQASGAESCTNAVMSSNVEAALRQYGCNQEMTGAYTVYSNTVNSTDDILVSVQIFAFKDTATAKAFDALFPATGTWDFGIWCPSTGDGANPCSANSDYADADRSEILGQSYRYVIEATALYTQMTTSNAEHAWTDAAANEAVGTSGPANYAAASG